jgi:exopolyphosphatase/guanosine-5'-triphosphate,3'-diphosphate pyrophosphatase
MNKKSKKISCIDIGSNAIKYRQYRLLPNNQLELDTFKRISLRLGSDAFSHGKMTSKTFEDFVAVLKKLKKHAKKKNADLIGIFATSAMRTFSNKERIIKNIKKELNLEIEILSGKEEASLLKFFNFKEFKASKCLLVDVGGGSTEIYLFDKNEEKLQSFNLGAVRILKGLDKDKNWQELSNFLLEINSDQIQNIIGIGGNAKQIIQAAGVLKNSLTLEELKEIRSRIGKLSLEEKISDYNFPSDRADIIEHAANIFEFILMRFKNAEFFASNWNISDGYIYKKNIENYQATSLEVS